MNEVAKYSFLPFVRQGLGTQISETDNLGVENASGVKERPEVLVSVVVSGTDTGQGDSKTKTVSKQVKLLSPGDILGIHASQVLRVHPASGVDNFETNNLVYIEFYEEDFPWRYTPAKPAGIQLRPWITLLVLCEDEFEYQTRSGTPVPFVRIHANCIGDALYPENEIHHFAHVQVLQSIADDKIGDASQAGAAISEVVQRNPDLALSRLISPRKLSGNTHYHAFLVPAYETGRLAGLGQSTANVPAQQASWKLAGSSANIDMPFYYTWEFSTGSSGDFQTLVSKLTPQTESNNTGREMDLSDPGLGLHPTNSDAVALMEGALKSLGHSTPAWPKEDMALKSKLLEILNLNETLRDKDKPKPPSSSPFYSPNPVDDPIITPPIYGQWHAAVKKLTASGSSWVHQLNLHPSNRAAAGLGTQVVKEHQEKFMEIAWNQIGPINEANQRIIESEAVRKAAEILYKKNIGRMDKFSMINTVGKAMDVLPVFSINGSSHISAKKSLQDSKIPTAFKTGTFTRIANNFTRTALMDRDGEDGVRKVLNDKLLERTNRNEQEQSQAGYQGEGLTSAISAAPPRKTWQNQLNPFMVRTNIDTILNLPPVSFMANLCSAIAATGLPFNIQNAINNIPAGFTETEKKRAKDILKAVTNHQFANDGVLTLHIQPSVFSFRINKNYNEGVFQTSQVLNTQVTSVKLVKADHVGETLIFDQQEVIKGRKQYREDFQHAFFSEDGAALLSYIRKIRKSLQLDEFSKDVMQGFQPGPNLFRRLRGKLKTFAASLDKPLMAYPRFPVPVYHHLKDLSADYILPNVSNIPENTIALMTPNTQFIESFLAGMNHEFARELLWREFPTDMRGSYFRHFWEYDNDPTCELLPMPNESEDDFNRRVVDFQNKAVDINEMHRWSKALGNNHERSFGLMLLFRGELFKKYPGTLVYLQRGEWHNGIAGAMPRKLSSYEKGNVQWPMISGNIEPDIWFFGFSLEAAAAAGNTTNNPGWFVVLRERPGEISFGLADHLGNAPPGKPANWDKLTWSHLDAGGVIPKYLRINNFPTNATPTASNGVQWNQSSAETAYILYQNPVIFAKHASLLLT